MTRFQPFNDLPASQIEGLKRDVERRGIVNPILVDEHDKTIDGHQRRRVAAELGIDCPRTVIEGLTDDEKMSLAIALNTFRRHLSGVERSKAMQQMANLGMSVRRIAEATGIPRSTVQRDIASGVPLGTPEPPPGVDPETGEVTRGGESGGSDVPAEPPAASPKRTGMDGKKYEATKPPAPPKEPTALDIRIAFHASIGAVQKAMAHHDWDELVAAFASGDEIDRGDLPCFVDQLRRWANEIDGALSPSLRRVK